ASRLRRIDVIAETGDPVIGARLLVVEKGALAMEAQCRAQHEGLNGQRSDFLHHARHSPRPRVLGTTPVLPKAGHFLTRALPVCPIRKRMRKNKMKPVREATYSLFPGLRKFMLIVAQWPALLLL